MKFFNIVMLSACCALTAINVHASAPAHQSMSDEVVKLVKENEKLKNQLKNNEPGCCANLEDKCNNVGNRTDICFYQRVAYPFSVITCQKKIIDPKYLREADCCCEKTTVITKNAIKLLSSLSCLVPTEIICCPFYAVCGAECAKTCLCLE